MNALKRILARLREPSTMAGLAALVALFGVPAGLSDALMQGLAGIAAALAILLPEGASKDEPKA